MEKKFDESAKKLLADVWNASSYRIVQALSLTLVKKVNLNNSMADLKNLRNLPEMINPNNTNVAVVLIELKGEINGTMFISSKDMDMMQFADILLRNPAGTSKNLNKENLGVIKELGNLLGGYYLDGFIELLDKKIKLGTPEVFFNENRVIEHSGLGNVYLQDIQVLLFEAGLSVETGASCKVIMIFHEKSLNEIFSSVLQKI